MKAIKKNIHTLLIAVSIVLSFQTKSEELDLLTLETNQLSFIKVKLEEQIEQRLGRPVLCPLQYVHCIQVYERILSHDLARAQLNGEGHLYIYSQLPPMSRTWQIGDIFIDYFDSTETLAEKLGIFQSCPDLSTTSFTPVAQKTIDASWALSLYRIVHEENNYSLEDYYLELNDNACPDPNEYAATSPFFPTCSESATFYEQLFNDENVMITIVHGYEDASMDVRENEYRVMIKRAQDEFNDMIEQLQSLGFELIFQSELTADLQRRMNFNGRQINLNARLVLSTIQCEGEEGNYGSIIRFRDQELCDEQVRASSYAREVFENALENDQIVIYSGHSRYGNGPDFGPYHEDYGKFAIRHGAMEDLEQENTQSVLFLNSCSSTSHFTDSIQDYRLRLARDTNTRNITLVSNQEPSHSSDGPDSTVNLIAGLIEQECPEEIQRRIEFGRRYRPTPMHIEGGIEN